MLSETNHTTVQGHVSISLNMLRLTTLCSTNITAVWIECKAGIKKTQPQKTHPKTKYIEGKVHINSDQNTYLIIFLVEIILQTQKRAFIYGLSMYPIAIIYEYSYFS